MNTDVQHGSNDQGDHCLPQPKMGPDPTLLNRKEVDALYEMLSFITHTLSSSPMFNGIDYIITGGSLLGAVRQHSILFCDDDIDIAVIGDEAYEVVARELPSLLEETKLFHYTKRPWEGGDRIRHKKYNTVFVDIFTIRKYSSMVDLHEVIGVKQNGKAQLTSYFKNIYDTIESALSVNCRNDSRIETEKEKNNSLNEIFPFWHFNTRKAIELWPKEVYRTYELFPIQRTFKMGPVQTIAGPHMPVVLLERAFGRDCFDVYYASASHSVGRKVSKATTEGEGKKIDGTKIDEEPTLQPLILPGGTWTNSSKIPLQPEHFIPMQSLTRSKRRHTLHNRSSLQAYLDQQRSLEYQIQCQHTDEASLRIGTVQDHCHDKSNSVPNRTVYMDGVFDLMHVGHLKAIEQCTKLGSRVIIGVTGDQDASGYKRPPIFSQQDRKLLIASVKGVNDVVCPCPLIVTKDFMDLYRIDLVVHGFASETDAARQYEFFEEPMKLGKFQRIDYYKELNTTDIIRKIQSEYTED